MFLPRRAFLGSKRYCGDTFRGGVVRLDRWVGLSVGLVALFLALTGGWIVLRPALDPIVYPDLMIIPVCTKPLPVDALASAAREFHPKGTLDFVYLYSSSTSTMMRFSDADQVYVDSCTGEILGHQARYGGLYGTIEALHRLRFIKGRTATVIIGTTAILVAFVLVAGGVFIWRPAITTGSKSVLADDAGSKGRENAISLHSTLGLYAGAIIFVVALTAIPLSFGWAKAALFVATGTTDMTDDAPPRRATLTKHAGTRGGSRTTPISMQAAWDKARALVGEPLVWASLHYPADGQAIEIAMVRKDAPHGEARSYVYLDPRSDKVVAFRPYAALDAGSKLYYWALAIHTGRAGGVFVQLLMLFGTLCMTAIGYTGVESFLRKKLRRPSPR